MNLFTISTAKLVAVNRTYAIAVKYFHRTDSCSLAALHIAELLLEISRSFNSVR